MLFNHEWVKYLPALASPLPQHPSFLRSSHAGTWMMSSNLAQRVPLHGLRSIGSVRISVEHAWARVLLRSWERRCVAILGFAACRLVGRPVATISNGSILSYQYGRGVWNIVICLSKKSSMPSWFVPLAVQQRRLEETQKTEPYVFFYSYCALALKLLTEIYLAPTCF